MVPAQPALLAAGRERQELHHNFGDISLRLASAYIPQETFAAERKHLNEELESRDTQIKELAVRLCPPSKHEILHLSFPAFFLKMIPSSGSNCPAQLEVEQLKEKHVAELEVLKANQPDAAAGKKDGTSTRNDTCTGSFIPSRRHLC